jgi:hypothetical protein
MGDTTHPLKDPLKDAAYITIGFGVLAFQKAQVARVDLTKQLAAERARVKAQLEEIRTIVDAEDREGAAPGQVTGAPGRGASGLPLHKLARQLDEKLAPVAKELETRLDEIVARLPEQLQDAVAQARQHAKGAAQQLRSLAG